MHRLYHIFLVVVKRIIRVEVRIFVCVIGLIDHAGRLLAVKMILREARFLERLDGPRVSAGQLLIGE